MQPALEIKDVSLAIDKKQILTGINARITAGAIVGLLGPSGAGKTTLIRAILGIRRPNHGEISVLGLPAGSRQLKTRVGYVSQASSVYPDLTVEENIRYFAELLHINKAEALGVIRDVELDPYRSRVVDTLSGGQKARVALAAALLGNPELLLLDEPTVGLDPVLRRSLWRRFRTLAKNGTTILISSHVMDEASKCDTLLFMREGKVLIFDTKDAVLEKTGADSMEDAFLRLATGGSDAV